MTNLIQIGKLKLKSNILVAPMTGISDFPFRLALQDFNPGYVMSEMVASEYLGRGHQDAMRKTAGAGKIEPLAIQLVGREAKWMHEGASIAQDAGAKVIDINMGCPARRVTNGQSGSALMRDLDHAMTLIEATLSATDVPVTLKMRLGWDDDSINASELAQRAEAAGVQMIVVHGRTRCQYYNGNADWEAVGQVKRAVNIPVIVNGDIRSPEAAVKAMQASGANGIMVGRGLIGRPWLVSELMATLSGTEYLPISPEQAFNVFHKHFLHILDFYGREKGIKIARKHVKDYINKAPFKMDDQFRTMSTIRACNTMEELVVIRIMEKLFLNPEQTSLSA